MDCNAPRDNCQGKISARLDFYLYFVTELIRLIPQDKREGATLILDEFGSAATQRTELRRFMTARSIPRSFKRILVKRWEALGDGLLDAAVGARLEAMRPKRQQSAENLDRQMGKMRSAVDAMSRDLGDRAWCNGEAYTLADIATGVALAYLDFRHPEFAWRDSAPNLARQLQKLAKRPSFDHTQP